MSYNSKYTGQQVESLLDQVASGNTGGGKSEVYIGNDEPTDGNIELWVDESVAEVIPDDFIIDEEMSDSSENVVQNKVIKQYIDSIVGNINVTLDIINGEEV